MDKDLILNTLKEQLNIHPLRVHNIYLYGSRVYGTAHVGSDYDFIVVANNSVDKKKLDWNDPKIFECILWSKENPILEKKEYLMDIEVPKFRHAVSHVSSTAWVKGKKKLLQEDIYLGQKSIFHSLRIPMFATQIMKDGKITDWNCANDYWEEIKMISDWKTLKDKFQPIRNKIMTQFRELCPKD